MTVAWLGTPSMGAPMARHVAEAGEHVRAQFCAAADAGHADADMAAIAEAVR